jgi:hypothetical protein
MDLYALAMCYNARHENPIISHKITRQPTLCMQNYKINQELKLYAIKTQEGVEPKYVGINITNHWVY